MLNSNFFYSNLLKIILILAVFSFVGLSVVSNHGISSDEGYEILMVQWNIDLIKNDKPIPLDLKYYGTFFNSLSEFFYFLKIKLFDYHLDYHPVSEVYQGDLQFYERVKVKHVMTFVMSIITLIAVSGICWVLLGAKYAWLGAFTLALFPRFWGHSFFNPKDIPFAAMFTLGIFVGGKLICSYLARGKNENIVVGLNYVTVFSLFYGVLIGMVTGVRAGGLFLLFFVVLVHFVLEVRTSGFVQFFRNFLGQYVLIFLGWVCTTIVLYPASWANPVGWLVDALQYLSAHEWPGTVLFEGAFLRADSLPWYYLPKWLLITIPVYFQAMFIAGLWYIVSRYNSFSKEKLVFLLLLFMQLLFFPKIAIFKGSTIYDGMRQFLFVLPALAIISAMGQIYIYKLFSRTTMKASCIIFLMMISLSIVVDMVKMHPYEYTYFNKAFGGIKNAVGVYETDYWGLSMREGMEWINKQSDEEIRVVSSTQLVSSKPFAAQNVDVISVEELRQKNDFTPFYYIARPRWSFQDKFMECEVVHRVMRQGAGLTVVKFCEE